MDLTTDTPALDETSEPKPRRPREYELDVLIAHELATGSPAAELLWAAAARAMPPTVKVGRQVRRDDLRTSDVVAIDGELQLMCEDKLADGVEEPSQFKSLAEEVRRRPATRRALVVAPCQCLQRYNLPDRLKGELKGLVKGVAVEDLAAELESTAADLGDEAGSAAELRRSYEHRAAALRALCATIKPTPK